MYGPPPNSPPRVLKYSFCILPASLPFELPSGDLEEPLLCWRSQGTHKVLWEETHLEPDQFLLRAISWQEGECGGGAQRKGQGRIWGQATQDFADRAPSPALTAGLPHTHRWAALRFLAHCLSSWETSSSEEFSLPSDQKSLGPSGLW